MAKYIKKPIPVEAVQWNKMGDVSTVVPLPDVVAETLYKRDMTRMGCDIAKLGWIGTLEGGHIVDPGDWILTGIDGEQWPVKPDIFARTYEKVE